MAQRHAGSSDQVATDRETLNVIAGDTYYGVTQPAVGAVSERSVLPVNTLVRRSIAQRISPFDPDSKPAVLRNHVVHADSYALARSEPEALLGIVAADRLSVAGRAHLMHHEITPTDVEDRQRRVRPCRRKLSAVEQLAVDRQKAQEPVPVRRDAPLRDVVVGRCREIFEQAKADEVSEFRSDHGVVEVVGERSEDR